MAITTNTPGGGLSNDYSLQETPIGNWYDGRKIYRKLIEVNESISSANISVSWYSNSSDTEKAVVDEVLNTPNIIKAYGIVHITKNSIISTTGEKAASRFKRYLGSDGADIITEGGHTISILNSAYQNSYIGTNNSDIDNVYFSATATYNYLSSGTLKYLVLEYIK